MSELAPVGRQETAVTQVYRELRRAILQGALRPGERLIETTLAKDLRVSRTPVREALSKLEVEGLARPLPNGGVVVGDTPTELEEIYSLRRLIEGHAARLAAQRITAEELARLGEVNTQSERKLSTASAAERAELNQGFHYLLAAASHSPRIVRLVTEYYEYSVTDRLLEQHTPDITKHQADHHQIVAALAAHDANLAERLVHEHIERVFDVITEALQLKSSSLEVTARERPFAVGS